MNLFLWKNFAILQKILLEKNNSVTNSLLFWKIESPKKICQKAWLSSELLKHYCFTDYLFIYLFFPPLVFQAYLGRLVGGSNPVNCSSQAKPSQAAELCYCKQRSLQLHCCCHRSCCPQETSCAWLCCCRTSFASVSETRRRG